MIRLELKNNKIITFNLKNFEQEKKLRNTWYAMSDTERFFSKKLKIKTDQAEEFEFEIGDITNCTQTDQEYDYKTEPTESPILKNYLPGLLKSIGVDDTLKEEIEDSLTNVGDTLEKIVSIIQELYDTIPSNLRRKIFLYYVGIVYQQIPVDISDPVLIENLRGALIDSEVNVFSYVNKYCEHKKSKKCC